MPNLIKYTTGTESGTISKGNFRLFVAEEGKGPTSTTGFWNGYDVPDGGWVVYLQGGSGGPSVYGISTLAELLIITRNVSGNSYTTAAECLEWAATQSTVAIVNKQYPWIVTDGLVLNLDAGFVPSYPTTGTIWRDLSGNNKNGSLQNGPTFNPNGWIVLDGVNDVINFGTGQNFLPLPQFTINIIFRSLGTVPTTGTTPGLFGFTFGIRAFLNASAITFGVDNGSDINGVSTSSIPFRTDEKWYNVTFYHTGTNMGIYVNGIFNNSINRNWNGTGRYQTNAWQLGRDNNNSFQFFKGDIALAQIYNRVLSSQEILQNYYQSPIVTDSLVFAVDAGNLISYEPGTTSSYSLVDSSTSSLINGVSYSTVVAGTWVFDGVDDYISLPSSLDTLNGTTEASLSIWVKLNSGSNPSGRSGIIQLSGYNNSNGCLYYYTNSTNVGGIWLDIFRTDRVFTGDWQPTFNGTLWHNIVITTTPGTNGWKMHLNGNLRFQTTGQNTVSVNSSLFGGFRLGQNSGGRDLWGNIATTLIYNRALSAAEIVQNFNAQRSRFGV